MKEYAAYKGEKFLAMGTVRELSKKLNLKESTIRKYTTNWAKKRSKENSIIVFQIEEEEE